MKGTSGKSPAGLEHPTWVKHIESIELYILWEVCSGGYSKSYFMFQIFLEGCYRKFKTLERQIFLSGEKQY